MSDEELFLEDHLSPDPALSKITHAILGACIEVHRTLGPGFPEQVYCKSLEVEFRLRGINFQRECPIEVIYRGELVGHGRMGFFVEGQVVLEIKAIDALTPIHTAQVIAYLRATGQKLGLLINFNVRVLKDGVRRIAA
jgi:GxxExxY protein